MEVVSIMCVVQLYCPVLVEVLERTSLFATFLPCALDMWYIREADLRYVSIVDIIGAVRQWTCCPCHVVLIER